MGVYKLEITAFIKYKIDRKTGQNNIYRIPNTNIH